VHPEEAHPQEVAHLQEVEQSKKALSEEELKAEAQGKPSIKEIER